MTAPPTTTLTSGDSTRTDTLRHLVESIADTGAGPTDAEIAAVIDQVKPGSTAPGALTGIRKRFAVACARLTQQHGTSGAAEQVEEILDEFQPFSSSPGASAETESPDELAANVDRRPAAAGPNPSGAARANQLRPLREILTSAAKNGAPDPAEVQVLDTHISGAQLDTWIQDVIDACEGIYAAGGEGDGTRVQALIDDALDQLSWAIGAPEDKPDTETDPYKLAARISRSGMSSGRS